MLLLICFLPSLSLGDHLCEVCSAVYCSGPVVGGTELPGYLHSQGHATGREVGYCVSAVGSGLGVLYLECPTWDYLMVCHHELCPSGVEPSCCEVLPSTTLDSNPAPFLPVKVVYLQALSPLVHAQGGRAG